MKNIMKIKKPELTGFDFNNREDNFSIGIIALRFRAKNGEILESHRFSGVDNSTSDFCRRCINDASIKNDLPCSICKENQEEDPIEIIEIPQKAHAVEWVEAWADIHESQDKNWDLIENLPNKEGYGYIYMERIKREREC